MEGHSTSLDCSENMHINIKEKNNIIWNTLMVSFSFTLTFTAYRGLGNLQSSLHRDGGLGTISQTVLYAGFIIGCLLLPKIMIHRFGPKWSMAIALVGYAVWGTLVPASLICGLAAAPLYTGQASYFNILAEKYALLMNESKAAAIAKFSGIFFCFYQISYLASSVISSTLLDPGDKNGSLINADNLQWCGVLDCPNNPLQETFYEPSDFTVWVLVGVLFAIGSIGLIIMCLFAQNIRPHQPVNEKLTCRDSMVFAAATLKHLRHREQILLIPITMYGGLQVASATAEFTKSFVTCSVGIWKVGFVFIPYGIVNAAVSLLSGQFVKYTGRKPIFIAVFILDLIKMIVLLLWMPHPNQEYVLYIIASVWGCCDGIWRTQNRALYGVLFEYELEAAFSNFHMWESLGTVLSMGYSAYICTSVKLYVTMAFLCLGMMGYLIVEYLEYTKGRDKKNDANKSFKLSEGKSAELNQPSTFHRC